MDESFFHRVLPENFIFVLIIQHLGAPQRVLMFSKLVLLEQLRVNSEFDSHLVPYTYGLGTHRSYAYKITIIEHLGHMLAHTV